jgi:hypothetical protein
MRLSELAALTGILIDSTATTTNIIDIEIIAFIERSPWIDDLIVSEFDLGVHAPEPKFGSATAFCSDMA